MHFSVSGDYTKALDYSVIAGDKAKAAYANTDAVRHYGRAIEAARRQRDRHTTEQSLLWQKLGEVQDLMGQFEASRESFSRGLGHARTSPQAMAELYLRRAESWYGSGNLTQAKRNLTQGRAALSRASGPDAGGLAARIRAYEASVLAGNGEFRRSLTVAREAVDLANQFGEEEAKARSYTVLDGANFMLGNDEPLMGEEAVTIFERLGLLDRSVVVLNNLGAYAYWGGDWEGAMAWYQQGVDAAERSGNVVVAAHIRIAIAEVLIGQRRFEEAGPLLKEAERVIRSAGAEHWIPFLDLQMARYDIGTGEVDSAINSLERQTSEQLAGVESDWTAEVVVVLAGALITVGRLTDSLALLDRFEREHTELASQVKPGITRLRAMAIMAEDTESAGAGLLDALADAKDAGDALEIVLDLELLTEMGPTLVGSDPFSPSELDSLRSQLRIRDLSTT
jgi:tetratricopeptide (TPR) repeat protein